jgi:hypothetical protein
MLTDRMPYSSSMAWVDEPVGTVATSAKSGACASSQDALRADSDLRAYGPCVRRDGTAGTPELLPQIK